ncbi:MAG: HTTM domain-containing protein [Verrucomicrobiota bacterium]
MRIDLPQSALTLLSRPIDISMLVYARIVFGLIMIWEAWRYHAHDRIFRYWIEPEFNFPYPGFSWLSPLPGDGMYYLFIAFAILSLCIVLGLFYRVASTLFAIAFTYMFLLEQGRYLNHFYLIVLLSWIMAFLPANRVFSLDSLLGISKKSDHCPAWSLWILRFQLAVVYFYGGLAKLNSDWLAGEPLRDWLGGRTHKPVIGPYLDSEPVIMTMAWGGMLFDLLIPFLLFWKPTRIPAFLLAVGFHLSNAFVWNIGIFPWLAIGLTVIFFSPDLPRKLLRLPKAALEEKLIPSSAATYAILVLFCLSQLIVPLRHWVIPGQVVWTEQGHRFSWRMKLRSRDGRTDFYAIDLKNGDVYKIDPYDYLEGWQIDEVDTNPDMILTFAGILKADFLAKRNCNVSIHAHSRISVNGRPRQPYFSFGLDLSEISSFELRHRWMNQFDSSRPTGEIAAN